MLESTCDIKLKNLQVEIGGDGLQEQAIEVTKLEQVF